MKKLHNILIHRPLITKNVRCVYKFSFADGSFYIGSTQNLHERLCNYKRNFYTGIVNKKVAAKLELFKEVVFEIIEMVPEATSLKEVEQTFIRKFTYDQNMLNSKRFWI